MFVENLNLLPNTKYDDLSSKTSGFIINSEQPCWWVFTVLVLYTVLVDYIKSWEHFSLLFKGDKMFIECKLLS